MQKLLQVYIIMSGERYNLVWDSFQKTLASSIESIRREADYCDVTLVSDDQIQIKAHKVIISACSPFFNNIFKSNPHQHPLIYLNGVKERNLKLILDYIYTGQVQIEQDGMYEFLDAAGKLQIAGLTNDIVDSQNQNIENMSTKKEEITTDLIPSSSPNQTYSRIVTRTRYATKQRYRVNSQEELQIRIQENTDDDTLSCRICHSTFKVKHQIVKHVATHFEGLSFPCSLCGRTYPTADTLRVHNYRCPKNSQTPAAIKRGRSLNYQQSVY